MRNLLRRIRKRIRKRSSQEIEQQPDIHTRIAELTERKRLLTLAHDDFMCQLEEQRERVAEKDETIKHLKAERDLFVRKGLWEVGILTEEKWTIVQSYMDGDVREVYRAQFYEEDDVERFLAKFTRSLRPFSDAYDRSNAEVERLSHLVLQDKGSEEVLGRLDDAWTLRRSAWKGVKLFRNCPKVARLESKLEAIRNEFQTAVRGFGD